MIVELELNRKLLKELGPYAFLVLVYYKGYYEIKDKVCSITQAAKDLGMSYMKTRSSLARIYYILTNGSFVNINIKEYIFIIEKGGEAYRTEIGRNEKRNEKNLEEKMLWKQIVSQIQDVYKPKISVGFYWRTQAWMKNLIEKVGKDNIQNYTDWFIKFKLTKIDKFNSGIFSCDPMIKEFKEQKVANKKIIARKRIDNKKESFELQVKKQDEKMLKNILAKRRLDRELDTYDLEMLEHFKEKGIYSE